MVSDGAAWIKNQCHQALGADTGFLLDFYHVCEYLAAAAPGTGDQSRWLNLQKRRLKANRADLILGDLEPRIEADHLPDLEAPVRVAIRYIENHRDQLDYKSAIEKDLPIGSGVVEASHRHVLQKRLKISGAWWTAPNALAMSHLRVLRANDHEDLYWQNLKSAA